MVSTVLEVVREIRGDAFAENQHPRDGAGRFSKKGGAPSLKRSAGKVKTQVKSSNGGPPSSTAYEHAKVVYIRRGGSRRMFYLRLAAVATIISLSVMDSIGSAHKRYKRAAAVNAKWQKEYNDWARNQQQGSNRSKEPSKAQISEWHKALGLEAGASFEDIKSAYRQTAKKFHPDINKDPAAQEMMKAVNVAFENLERIRGARTDNLLAVLNRRIDFVESQHPRDKGGRFATKEGRTGGRGSAAASGKPQQTKQGFREGRGRRTSISNKQISSSAIAATGGVRKALGVAARHKGVTAAALMVVSAAAGAQVVKSDLKLSQVPFDSIRTPPNGIPDEQTLKKYDEMQPGDLIRKGFKAPIWGERQHYGVYIGKDEHGRHMLVEMTDETPDGVPRAQIGYLVSDEPDTDSTEYEKVPPELMGRNKKAKVLERDEIVDRAMSMVGQNFSYLGFKSNCESFARGIVEGSAYSTQGDKITPFTNTVAAFATNTALSTPYMAPGYFRDKTRISAKDMVAQFEREEARRSRKNMNVKGAPAAGKLIKADSEQTPLMLGSIADQMNLAINPDGPTDEGGPTQLGLRDPKEFAQLVEDMAKAYPSLAKQIRIEMYQNYLLLLTALMSRAQEGVKDRKDGFSVLQVVAMRCDRYEEAKHPRDKRGQFAKKKSSNGISVSGKASKTYRGTRRQRSPVSLAFKTAFATAPLILGGGATLFVVTELNKGSVSVSETNIPKEGKPDFSRYDDFQPGDLIRKSFTVPGAPKGKGFYHYAVYMGKDKKTGEHRIIQCNSDPKDPKGPVIVAEFSMEKEFNGLNRYAQTHSSYYEKVPDDGTERLSAKEIVFRAESLVGQPYKYGGLRDNCESLARMIAEGSPRETQGNDLSRAGRGVVNGLVGRLVRHRIENSEIWKGKEPKTAQDFADILTQLQEGTLPAEIKEEMEANAKNWRQAAFISDIRAKENLKESRRRAYEAALYQKAGRKLDSAEDDLCRDLGLKSPAEFAATVSEVADLANGILAKEARVYLWTCYLELLLTTVHANLNGETGDLRSLKARTDMLSALARHDFREELINRDRRGRFAAKSERGSGPKGKAFATSSKAAEEGGLKRALKRTALATAITLGAGTVLALGIGGAVVANDLASGVMPEKEFAQLSQFYAQKKVTEVIYGLKETDHYEDFKKGDLIRRPISTPLGIRHHYAVYTGRDENGEHKVIHLNVEEEDNIPKIRDKKLSNDGGIPFERVPDKEMYAKGTKRLTPDEIVQRAESLLGQPFEYTGFDSNCESVARAIVEDLSYSVQGDSVSPFTKAVTTPIATLAFRLNAKSPSTASKMMTSEQIAQMLAKSQGKQESKADSEMRGSTGYLDELRLFINKDGVLISPKELGDMVKNLMAQIPGSLGRAAVERLIKNYLMMLIGGEAIKRQRGDAFALIAKIDGTPVFEFFGPDRVIDRAISLKQEMRSLPEACLIRTLGRRQDEAFKPLSEDGNYAWAIGYPTGLVEIPGDLMQRYRIALAGLDRLDRWDPKQHPRDKNGRFASKTDGGNNALQGGVAIAERPKEKMGGHSGTVPEVHQGKSGDYIRGGDKLIEGLLDDPEMKAATAAMRQARDNLMQAKNQAQEKINQGQRLTHQDRMKLLEANRSYERGYSRYLPVAERRMTAVRQHLIDTSPISREEAEANADKRQIVGRVSLLPPGNRKARELARESLVEFQQITGYDPPTVKKIIVNNGFRSYTDPYSGGVIISKYALSKGEVFHEVAHHLEFNSKEIPEVSKEFVQKRADLPHKLSLAIVDPAYHPSEMAYRDDFIHPYVGKTYENHRGETFATEVISMGMQFMEAPRSMAMLYAYDDEHFRVTVGAIAKSRAAHKRKDSTLTVRGAVVEYLNAKVGYRHDYDSRQPRDEHGRFASKGVDGFVPASAKVPTKPIRGKWGKRAKRAAAVAGILAGGAALAAAGTVTAGAVMASVGSAISSKGGPSVATAPPPGPKPRPNPPAQEATPQEPVDPEVQKLQALKEALAHLQQRNALNAVVPPGYVPGPEEASQEDRVKALVAYLRQRNGRPVPGAGQSSIVPVDKSLRRKQSGGKRE